MSVLLRRSRTEPWGLMEALRTRRPGRVSGSRAARLSSKLGPVHRGWQGGAQPLEREGKGTAGGSAGGRIRQEQLGGSAPAAKAPWPSLPTQLNSSATLNEFVKRIRLPSPRIDLKPGTVCYVMGWGDTSNFGDQPTELMETNTTIVRRSLCRTLWRGKVSANMLCGASRNTTLQGVCAVSEPLHPCPTLSPHWDTLASPSHPLILQGDSGGPLVFKGKVYGIVSFSGERCGDRRFPDIYTKISNYIDWVHHVVRGSRRRKGWPKP